MTRRTRLELFGRQGTRHPQGGQKIGARQHELHEHEEGEDMNRSQGRGGQQGHPLLLIDEGVAVLRGTGGRGAHGCGQGTMSWDLLQRLALQGRKARGMDTLPLTQITR